MRTLIVAQGLEKARIIAAVSIHAPNKIIVLRNTNEITEKLKKQINDQMEALKKQILGTKSGIKPFPFVTTVDVASHALDFFDVTGSLLVLEKLIASEKKQGNQVFLDVSSGNKTIAIAMFLAAQTAGLGVTYCKASSYLDSTEQIVRDVKEPIHIPALPLSLQKLDYAVLRKLSELGSITSISDLLRLLDKKTDKSSIMSMARTLDELKEYGYVSVRRVGKRKEINITAQGKQVAGVAHDQ